MLIPKPKVLFFARGYQADFFPTLGSDRYESVFVTLTPGESARVERRGQRVEACFEADFGSIRPAEVPEGYLGTSLMSDRFLGRFDDAKRIEILAKEIAFWSDLLDKHQPAAVVNELVAIEISEVLLIECRRRNIPYLAGMNCVVDGYFYWLPDPMTISGTRLSLPEPGPQALALADAYLEELSTKDYKPFYVQNLAGRRALAPLGVAILRAGLWAWRKTRDRRGSGLRYEMYDDEYGKKVAVYFKSLYRRYDRLRDILTEREIVFYPLHQEPEATLNYMSEFYANQVATIENILKCLGPHQVLVVKEHPVDKGALLRRKFWEIRQRFSGLYYLPAEVHGREVLSRAARVVTLTSTVGWEAAVAGREVLLLGEIFYDDQEGIPTPRDWRELKQLLRQPPPTTPCYGPEKARHFVAGMVEMSYPGNPFPHPGLYSARNVSLVVDAICAGAGIDGAGIPQRIVSAL